MSDTIESLGLLNRGEDSALDAIVRLGGDVVGTLCAWDSGAATLSDEQLAASDDLALLAARVLKSGGPEIPGSSVL